MQRKGGSTAIRETKGIALVQAIRSIVLNGPATDSRIDARNAPASIHCNSEAPSSKGSANRHRAIVATASAAPKYRAIQARRPLDRTIPVTPDKNSGTGKLRRSNDPA